MNIAVVPPSVASKYDSLHWTVQRLVTALGSAPLTVLLARARDRALARDARQRRHGARLRLRERVLRSGVVRPRVRRAGARALGHRAPRTRRRARARRRSAHGTRHAANRRHDARRRLRPHHSVHRLLGTVAAALNRVPRAVATTRARHHRAHAARVARHLLRLHGSRRQPLDAVRRHRRARAPARNLRVPATVLLAHAAVRRALAVHVAHVLRRLAALRLLPRHAQVLLRRAGTAARHHVVPLAVGQAQTVARLRHVVRAAHVRALARGGRRPHRLEGLHARARAVALDELLPLAVGVALARNHAVRRALEARNRLHLAALRRRPHHALHARRAAQTLADGVVRHSYASHTAPAPTLAHEVHAVRARQAAAAYHAARVLGEHVAEPDGRRLLLRGLVAAAEVERAVVVVEAEEGEVLLSATRQTARKEPRLDEREVGGVRVAALDHVAHLHDRVRNVRVVKVDRRVRRQRSVHGDSHQRNRVETLHGRNTNHVSVSNVLLARQEAMSVGEHVEVRFALRSRIAVLVEQRPSSLVHRHDAKGKVRIPTRNDQRHRNYTWPWLFTKYRPSTAVGSWSNAS